jgi:molybdopterin-guanine dinucleotide biosynthesis protein A
VSGTFHAIVLAGDRGPDDPLLRHTGVSAKALLPLAGQPMVLRVLDALGASTAIRGMTLVGPDQALLADCPALSALIAAGRLAWLPPQPSPSASALAALAGLAADQPVLLTTADHALLHGAWVDDFCAAALASDKDAVVGLTKLAGVQAAFPQSRRTALRFQPVCLPEPGRAPGTGLLAPARAAAQTAAPAGGRTRPWHLVEVCDAPADAGRRLRALVAAGRCAPGRGAAGRPARCRRRRLGSRP